MDFGCGCALEKIIEHLFGECEEIVELNLDYGDFENSILDWIVKSGSPVEIVPSDDVPFIGHQTVAEMKKFLDDWNDEKAEEIDDDFLEMVETTLEVFQKAVKKKKDLVIFVC
jgi:nitrogenase molybdenum-iron protein alpha/beta subunit